MQFPFEAFCGSKSKSSRTAIALAIVSAMAVGIGSVLKNVDLPTVNWSSSKELSDVSFVDKRLRDRVISLRGDWRFAIGDDPQRALRAFDDSAWSNVDVPSAWEGEGFRNYDGYAWYRRTFRFEGGAKDRPLYLLLGQVDDVDEVFVNGQRVGGTGQFPPDYASAFNLDRVYPLPKDLLEQGAENVIAVRVYDARLAGGIRSGTIGIYASELPPPLVDLSGIWKMRTGDDLAWSAEAADESQFAPINVPCYWDSLGFDHYDGYAWYRKTFSLGSVPSGETMVLLLGKIDDIDETFLNGTKIGSTGTPDDPSVPREDAWKRRRAYTFSSDLLKSENVLAVRVLDTHGVGGIYEGPVGIMTQTDYDRYWTSLESGRGDMLGSVFDWLLGRD